MQFTSLRVDAIDVHSAVIVWQTSIPSNGRIDYGEDLSAANRVALAVDVDTFHRTLLFGLREGEDHVCRVFASDTQGAQIRSGWTSFRTLGIPAPRIVRVDIKEQTWKGAHLEWISNIPVKGGLECGYDTSYGYSKKETAFGRVHEVHLDRFSPRRTVVYRITARDARGKDIPPYPGKFQTAEHNIAGGCTVAGTFFRNPDRPFITDSPPLLQRVTDGRTSYFTGMATSGNPAEETQWVEIDLGSIQDITHILTYWRRIAYPLNFTLKGSLDGDRWYGFGDQFTESGSAAVSETGDPMIEHLAAIGQYAIRYVRMEVPKGAAIFKKFDNYNFVQLFEVKVYPMEGEDEFLTMKGKK